MWTVSMKKKKFGKVIHNWHRPLLPSQLRQRFLRDRHGDPEATNEQRPALRSVEVDDCWNCYDPSEDWWHGDERDLSWVRLEAYLIQALHPAPLLFSPEWLADRVVESAAGAPSTRETPPVAPRPELEQRLADHIASILCFAVDPTAGDRIDQALGDPRDREVLRLVEANFASPELARRVCFFAPFWLRSPRTWDGEGEVSFLEHLFVRHEVPRFLYTEWFRGLDFPRFKWVSWFIVLAQGGSLRRAGEVFNWRIAPKLSHYLRRVPEGASPTEACIHAEILRLGGSAVEAARILRNPAFVTDPTEATGESAARTFWEDTVRWLSAHRDEISDDESDAVLSWSMHELTESTHAGRAPFSWSGRRARPVVARSLEYRRALRMPWIDCQWRRHGWGWELREGESTTWSFEELSSGRALYEEGEAMHHCVVSYVARCLAGQSAIVSLKQDGQRRLTIEIFPATRAIAQVRGSYNRAATADEERVILAWMSAVVAGAR